MAKILCAVALGIALGFSQPTYGQTGCSRPSNISINMWNAMSADAQAAMCRAARGVGVGSLTEVQPYNGCSRPTNISINGWNAMSADQQAAMCRALAVASFFPHDRRGLAQNNCSRPANISVNGWNALSADAQAAMCRAASGLAPNSAFATVGSSSSSNTHASPNLYSAPPRRCGRACGEPWTSEDFSASEREIQRLQREIDVIDRLLAAGSISNAPPQRSYTPPYVPPAYNSGPSSNSNRIGPFSFYSDSNGTTGTSQRLGPFTYYNFSDGVSGTSQRLGPFTYSNFNDQAGNSTTVTSQQLGPFTYHDFSNGVNGTSQQLGPFTFHNFSDGTHCTTQTIGGFTYTNCY